MSLLTFSQEEEEDPDSGEPIYESGMITLHTKSFGGAESIKDLKNRKRFYTYVAVFQNRIPNNAPFKVTIYHHTTSRSD